MNYQEQVDDAVARLLGTFTVDDVNDALGVAFTAGFRTSGFSVNPTSPPGMYIEAVRNGFYNRATELVPGRYRECAVVALLASQGADANLGYHLFIAAMVGISVNDVYDILLLTGIYAGVSRLTAALRVARATFDEVINAANQGDKTPGEVFARIKKAVDG
jgi:hypothetical protein